MTQNSTALSNLQQLAIKISTLSDQAYMLLSSQFRLLIDNEREVTVAEITSGGVIEAVTKPYVVEAHLLSAFGTQLTPSKISNELYPRWRGILRERNQPIPFDSVLPFVFKSQKLAPEQYAWQRLSFDHNPAAECPPTFKQMLERTTEEEARSLVLFVGSLFDYKFPRSQYVYMYGDGEDGKSTLLSALSGMFDKQGVTTFKSGDFADSHATTALERARLLIFRDQNNNSFMSTGHFKELTGDDVLTINPKGAPRRNIQLFCKVLIASNNAPNLSGGRADERRILPVKFAARNNTGADHGWVERFNAESVGIAQFCINEFAKWKLANPGKDIPAGAEAIEQVRAESLEAVAEGLVDQHFDFGTATALVLNSDLRAQVQELAKRDHALSQVIYKQLHKRGMTRSKAWNSDHTVRLNAWKGVQIHDVVVTDRTLVQAY